MIWYIFWIRSRQLYLIFLALQGALGRANRIKVGPGAARRAGPTEPAADSCRDVSEGLWSSLLKGANASPGKTQPWGHGLGPNLSSAFSRRPSGLSVCVVPSFRQGLPGPAPPARPGSAIPAAVGGGGPALRGAAPRKDSLQPFSGEDDGLEAGGRGYPTSEGHNEKSAFLRRLSRETRGGGRALLSRTAALCAATPEQRE